MGNILSALIFLAIVTPAFASESEQVRGWFKDVQSDPATQTKKSLTKQERADLFQYVVNHPVAKISPENDDKYDPTREVGYCYGRAMAVHLRARRMGLKPESLRKLFIVGDLRSGDEPEWRFHVTTLVKGEEGAWYAVDPILSGPMLQQAWVATVQSVWDKQKAAFFYVTDAVTVLPDIRVFPDKENENRNRLIELSFRPSPTKGFTKKIEGHTFYWYPSEEAQEKYFLKAYESVDREQFDFSELNIRMLVKDDVENKHYSYFGYFKDLIDDIRKATYVPQERKLGAGASSPKGTEIHGTEIHGTEIHGTEIHKGKNLRSIRFNGTKP